jgi:5-methylcytosine-specific restriction endonuclease McrA
VFELVDAEIVSDGKRDVFKFKLHVTDKTLFEKQTEVKNVSALEHNRMILTVVKLEVWKRDKGRCRTCGSIDNLHFDHILPYSLGGTSLKAENIQLLCARHNLNKSNKIL